ncbi:MAG: hypothetical protein ACODAB_07270 [Gemmatimonadota bacterium]
MPRREHYVTFYLPGLFVADVTSRPIGSWDTRAAAEMAREVGGANRRPYAFHFETRIVEDPIPDGEGGTLDVVPKVVERSGAHHLGGKVERYDEVEARGLEDERILRHNMRCNGNPIVVRGESSALPFLDTDVLVDDDGEVVRRGDDDDLEEYRRKFRSEMAEARGAN